MVLPKKICLGEQCKNLISMKQKYCSSCGKIRAMEKREHNKKYDEFIRDAEIKRFYQSIAWKKIRSFVLIRDNYLCQECLNASVITSAELVHHIREIKEDWSLRLEPNNCISVCKPCHNKIDHKY